MRYDDLTLLVQRRARLATRDAAERVTHATLQTLAERAPDTVTDALTRRLPSEFGSHLRRGRKGGHGAADDDFVARIAERSALDALRAAAAARTVLRVVDLETSGALVGQARVGLPEDVRDLVVRERDGRAAVRVSSRP